MGSRHPALPSRLTFYEVNRGGGLYAEAISQRAGAMVAWLSFRLGIAPTVLTLANLVVGVGASIGVTICAGAVATGAVGSWLVGVPALIAWQAAYILDCADGQLARVTGQTSAAGARVDIFCDAAVQIGILTALSSIMAAFHPDLPAWRLIAFAGTWMANLLAGVVYVGPNSMTIIASRSLPVRAIKLTRDYGALTFAAGLTLALAPQWMGILGALLTVINGTYLVSVIALSARAALRATT